MNSRPAAEQVSEEAIALLCNPVWHALRTEHAGLGIGSGLARRYPAEYIPFAGVALPEPSAFASLRAILSPGESIYITSEEPLAPPTGFALIGELPGLQMVYAVGRDCDAATHTYGTEPSVQLLTQADIPDMLALKEVAFPGYYGPRAPMLGTYYGIRLDGQLVAMAGERLALPGLREISAVCTHPAYVGRGYAARLMLRLIAGHQQAGLLSFLHLAAHNKRALALYERLGFVRSRSLLFLHIQRIEDSRPSAV